MAIDVQSVRRVVLFDLLGDGRIERAVELIARVFDPILRALGVHSALLFADGRPRRTGTIEELALVVPWRDLEQRVRDEFSPYLRAIPPDSPWQPALGSVSLAFEHARSVGMVAHALGVATRAKVTVVMRRGSKASLLRRLLASDKPHQRGGISVAGVLPPERTRKFGRQLTRAAVNAVSVPAKGSVLMVPQSRAIEQSLGEVAAQLARIDPALPVVVVDMLPWIESTAGTEDERQAVALGDPPALLGDSLDGLALMHATLAARAVVKVAALLARVHPRALVVGNDRFGSGVIATAAARRARIPTVLVQDGLAADIPPWWTCAAEVVCSCGEQLSDILERLGHRTRRVIITGQPRPHGVDAKRRRLGDRVASSRHGWQSVLVALQVHHGVEYCRELLAMVASIGSMPGVQLEVRVRMHPHQTKRVQEYVVRYAEQRSWIVDRSLSPVDSLAAATLVVGEYSTVLAEAVLAGIPAASFEPSLGPPLISLSRAGVAIPFTTAAELHAICQRPSGEVGEQLTLAQRQANYLLGSTRATAASVIAGLVTSAPAAS